MLLGAKVMSINGAVKRPAGLTSDEGGVRGEAKAILGGHKQRYLHKE